MTVAQRKLVNTRRQKTWHASAEFAQQVVLCVEPPERWANSRQKHDFYDSLRQTAQSVWVLVVVANPNLRWRVRKDIDDLNRRRIIVTDIAGIEQALTMTKIDTPWVWLLDHRRRPDFFGAQQMLDALDNSMMRVGIGSASLMSPALLRAARESPGQYPSVSQSQLRWSWGSNPEQAPFSCDDIMVDQRAALSVLSGQQYLGDLRAASFVPMARQGVYVSADQLTSRSWVDA